MPYKKFRKGGKYCIKNLKTGNITCFSSEEKRETGIRMREMFSHGFVPTNKTQTNVKAHPRKRTKGVIQHTRKLKKRKQPRLKR